MVGTKNKELSWSAFPSIFSKYIFFSCLKMSWVVDVFVKAHCLYIVVTSLVIYFLRNLRLVFG